MDNAHVMCIQQQMASGHSHFLHDYHKTADKMGALCLKTMSSMIMANRDTSYLLVALENNYYAHAQHNLHKGKLRCTVASYMSNVQ